jgi:hypothetical protein
MDVNEAKRGVISEWDAARTGRHRTVTFVIVL